MNLFTESEINVKAGSIEVICGSMFSGKTEELVRRIKRAEFANLSVRIFKPAIDKRYSANKVVSHDKNSVECYALNYTREILELAKDVDVVCIDEAQFFDNTLPAVVNSLANSGKRVIIAGLDMDFEGLPFGPIPALCAMADHVTKLRAICVKCGELALFSHRLTTSKQTIVIGEKEVYEPLCRKCFQKANKAGIHDNQLKF